MKNWFKKKWQTKSNMSFKKFFQKKTFQIGIWKGLKEFLITYPRFFVLLIITGFLPILIAIVFFLMLTATSPSVKVPQLTGLSILDATTLLQKNKIKANFLPKTSTDYPINYIVSQDIPAGRNVKLAREILLYVSEGTSYSEFPSFVGQNLYNVLKTLSIEDKDLHKVNVHDVNWVNSNKPFGQIISQSPESGNYKQFPIDISFQVSNGRQNIIPNYTHQFIHQVIFELTKKELHYSITEKKVSDSHEDGIVLKQIPSEGTLYNEGDFIHLIVGKKSDSVKQFQFQIPEDLNNKKIQLVFTDNKGSRILYLGDVNTGDVLYPTTQVFGNWKLMVYLFNGDSPTFYKEIQE